MESAVDKVGRGKQRQANARFRLWDDAERLMMVATVIVIAGHECIRNRAHSSFDLIYAIPFLYPGGIRKIGC